jgi:hypothetical protein
MRSDGLDRSRPKTWTFPIGMDRTDDSELPLARTDGRMAGAATLAVCVASCRIRDAVPMHQRGVPVAGSIVASAIAAPRPDHGLNTLFLRSTSELSGSGSLAFDPAPKGVGLQPPGRSAGRFVISGAVTSSTMLILWSTTTFQAFGAGIHDSAGRL